MPPGIMTTISANGILTAEGIEHQFDCIVFATGFDVGHSGTPFPVRGKAQGGVNATMYPGFATQYARQMASLELKDYELIPAG